MKRGWENCSNGKVKKKYKYLMWDTQHQLKDGHRGTHLQSNTKGEVRWGKCVSGVHLSQLMYFGFMMSTSGFHTHVYIHMYKNARAYTNKNF